MTALGDYVSEYCSSEHFMLLAAHDKEHAEALLAHWCGLVHTDCDSAQVCSSMNALARLDIPVETREQIPGLLAGFTGYLVSSGRCPQLASWPGVIEQGAAAFRDSIRADGTVRGETYRKKFSDVGRNDPCPCGSGQKFKKCCMKLIA